MIPVRKSLVLRGRGAFSIPTFGFTATRASRATVIAAMIFFNINGLICITRVAPRKEPSRIGIPVTNPIR